MSCCVLQECGADCAKFQKSELEFKFNRKALERPYTSKHSWGSTYGEHKRHLEFSHAQYRELQRYAQEIGIFFTASGMDEVSAQPLLGCRQLWCKVGSSSAHLNYVRLSGRPMGRQPREGVFFERRVPWFKNYPHIRAAVLDPSILPTVGQLSWARLSHWSVV